MVDFESFEKPKVLVVAMSGIGNLLMQTPTIRRLKEANPSSEISVLVAPRGTKEVLSCNPNVKNIYLGTPKPKLGEWLNIIKTVRKERFDFGLVTYPGQLITSSSILFFGKTRQRIGHTYSYLFLKDTSLFLNESVAAKKSLHDVEQNLLLLEAVGIETRLQSVKYDFPLSSNDRKLGLEFLEKNKLEGKKIIGIHPGTNADLQYKRWPLKRWAKLCEMLSEHYQATILIFGGENEHELKSSVQKNIHKPAIVVSATLPVTAAIISQCRIFISNDSGLMHVAVSQDVPTYGIFGPTDETRTAPWGPYGHVIRAEGTTPSYDVNRLKEIKLQKKADPTLLAVKEDFVFQRIILEQH